MYKKEQIAFPIFYHVDPSDVRNQRKSYGKAMFAHQKRFGKDSEKINTWTAALSDVANLKGHHINTGTPYVHYTRIADKFLGNLNLRYLRFEIDHVKEIAEKVHANIAPKPLIDGENPVGLDQQIEEVKSLLDLKPKDDTVCMLGIIGLGGIGKTELAKALYNKIVHQFEDASFLANVREKLNKTNVPEDLQKTLLSEMFEKQETEWGSTCKGIDEIKHKLGRKKVLLVLDDVNEMKQLENLAGGSDWFGPGSRIIITTRDKGLLMGYEALTSRAVGYAKGLPLALKVIGSNLATRKSLKAWESALEDYQRIPRKGIQDVLKVSYDVLESNAQSVFLDIACFFKGERIEYVEEILNEFSAVSNIEELVNKSLLNIDNGYLNMHDLIQDMGREIVRQEAPNNPAKRSRLWCHEDVVDVLSANDCGSDTIQGIKLVTCQLITKVDWNFEKMNRLRILIVRDGSFSSGPKHLPNHLRLLDWRTYYSKTFPPKFYPKNIIILNLPFSRLTMEDPFKQFSYLTVINFSNNKSITAMPDVSKVENLRELRLDYCSNLTMFHESVGFLKHLVHLSAPGCTKLENFLQRMFLPSLEVLVLYECGKLEHFPDIVKKMYKPLKIHMSYTSIKKLPNSISKLIGLVSIDMKYSEKLEYLPSSLFRLPNVVTFNFGSCSKHGESFKRLLPDNPSSETNERSTLKTIHVENSKLSDEDIEAILICFPNLEELIVSCNYNLVSLPACIKESNHLTYLDVSWCEKLKEIPECTNLRILNICGCRSLTHISELPCTIQIIDARKCINFSSETSDMLWDQVKKDRHGLEIVMPKTKIPKWFDYICKGGIPSLWIYEKFSNVALASLFEGEIAYVQDVQLHLAINGQYVPRKGYYNFSIGSDHVLVCDLRHLFNDEEWLSLDWLLLKNEWNLVQISYEINKIHDPTDNDMTLSEWGVFMYK
ncbi:hypothetical protein TSUD_253150 [Trifolium subterraneum]|nr:hypothetical protein TSUD_253150 [Trifolium subterraneum]